MSPEPTSSKPVPTGLGLGKSRIEALCDGVFAAAMTLLVFETKPPLDGGVPFAALVPHLVAMWPRFASCALSFVILGVAWVGHHNQFHYIQRSDRSLLWINIFFCLSVAFTPFSTSLLGQYLWHQTAMVVYGANLVLTSLLLYAQWAWATWHRHLVAADLDERVVRFASHRILMGPAGYALAIALSFLSQTAGLVLFALVPLLYILPGRVDFSWATFRRHPAPAEPAFDPHAVAEARGDGLYDY